MSQIFLCNTEVFVLMVALGLAQTKDRKKPPSMRERLVR